MGRSQVKRECVDSQYWARGRAKAEAAERVRAWDEAEATEKADIAMVAAQASKKAKAEAEERARVRVRVRDNASNIAVEEAATEIRDGVED